MRLTNKRLKELRKLESEDTKYCPTCKKVKSLVDFAVCSTGRKLASTYCRKCAKEVNILRAHGITLKDYDKMLRRQGGGCQICRTKIPGGKGRFHVDHNHATGEIRGLLCVNCNHGLGHFKDDIEILAAAIKYLIASRR